MSGSSGPVSDPSIDQRVNDRLHVQPSESLTKRDQKCYVTGFTEREKAVLKKSWSKMKGTTLEDMHELGLNLVLWMMDNIPDMRKRFHKFPANSAASVLKVDREFLSHSRKVIVELDELVKALYDPDIFKIRVLSLVIRHLNSNPPIGSYFFDPFHENFHVFIENCLDLPPEHEEVQLWTAFLGFILSVLKAEEPKHGMKSVDKSGCCILT